MSILLLIFAIILFVGLVVAHEFGHYIAARRGSIDVEEFGIGFPPKLWARKLKNGTLFTLNVLPLGGFVRLKGEHDSATAKGSFGAAPLKTKISVMLAGVGMNLVVAYILLTIVALIGMPQIIKNQYSVASDARINRQEVLVGFVESDSPAQKAGLRQRDRLVSFVVDGSEKVIASADELPLLTEQLAGKSVVLVYQRDTKRIESTLMLRSTEEVEKSKETQNPKGYLGISPTDYSLQRYTWSAPVVAAGVAYQFTTETFRGLGKALWAVLTANGSEASSQVSGPVGIVVLLKDGSSLGMQFVLMIIAIISLTLAIMNVLPIPALDGGRLFVTLWYRMRKRVLTQETEEKIHGIGFAILMLLLIMITFVDIRRFF